jgi:hypothetical protein
VDTPAPQPADKGLDGASLWLLFGIAILALVVFAIG